MPAAMRPHRHHDCGRLFCQASYLVDVGAVLRSDRRENQGRSSADLPATAAAARVARCAADHLDADEAVLGRGAGTETDVRRSRQSSQVHQQRKVSIAHYCCLFTAIVQYNLC